MKFAPQEPAAHRFAPPGLASPYCQTGGGPGLFSWEQRFGTKSRSGPQQSRQRAISVKRPARQTGKDHEDHEFEDFSAAIDDVEITKSQPILTPVRERPVIEMEVRLRKPAAVTDELAALSKHHFHPPFTAVFGIGVHRYVHALIRSLTNSRIAAMHRSEQVEIVQFKETRVLALEHHGDPALTGNSIRKFIDWRKRRGLRPDIGATFNIAYNDPVTTPPADYRLDICVASDRDIADTGDGIVGKVIPGGRCATLRHVGSGDTLAAAVLWLYRDWLPASGEALRDFPLFLQRVRFFPDVPEHESIVDIFLPLK